MMTKFFRFLKRIIWVSIFGTMIAFHNFYQQEFKAVEDVRQEVVEEEE
jgi:hypothetical protein